MSDIIIKSCYAINDHHIQCDTYSCSWLDIFIFIFVPIPLPPFSIKWCWSCYLASSDALSFLNKVSVTLVHRHGSRSSSTRPSSPFWPNSSNSTWIGTGTKSHLPSRWPEWLPWRPSSTTSLTAHRPSPTTSPCSHHSSQVEAYDTDDTISKVLSQPFSTDQQHPDRQPGLPVAPTRSVLCCLPKARARRKGNTEAEPQSNKKWVRWSDLSTVVHTTWWTHAAAGRYQNINKNKKTKKQRNTCQPYWEPKKYERNRETQK